MMRTAQFCCKFAIAKVPCCISRVFVVCFVVYKTQEEKKKKKKQLLTLLGKPSDRKLIKLIRQGFSNYLRTAQ